MTTYQRALVNGHGIFYREAGLKDAPTILLLHGFPTSSHMFRNLIPALADRYHVIAPDLPGFGFSDAPDRGPRPILPFACGSRRLRPNIVIGGVEGLIDRQWPCRRLQIGFVLGPDGVI